MKPLGSTQVILFVADFGGRLHADDITDFPDTPRPHTGPHTGPQTAAPLLHTWTAPRGILDTGLSNVRALNVDKIDDNHIRAYVGVPGYWIETLEFEHAAAGTWTFNPVTERFETPGDVYGLIVRPENSVLGLPKSLLVGDSYAGLRIYGEELP